jgi:glyoxylate reductase
MKVFITRPIPRVGITLLEEAGFDVVVNTPAKERAATPDEIRTGIAGADALLSVLTETIDSTVMDAGTPNLKIIANYAVGYDNIDLKAAGERNILVTNTPGILTESVAEHTIALLCTLARRIVEADTFTHQGKYTAWGPELLLGSGIAGKTLGIIGSGRIGSHVGRIAGNGLEMKILYTDIKQNSEFEQAIKAQFVAQLDDLLPQSDFITIHVPLLDATRHLIHAGRFKKMKKTAFLINTSRGPVVEEQALVHALAAQEIAGVALDVFEHEPAIAPELLSYPNVILTPHIASATRETRDEMARIASSNIIAALNGNKPPNLVQTS